MIDFLKLKCSKLVLSWDLKEELKKKLFIHFKLYIALMASIWAPYSIKEKIVYNNSLI